MDRVWLEQRLREGLSLAEIGRCAGKHESTIAYWLDRYGLDAVGPEKHTPKGASSRHELEALVAEGASLTQIAEKLERSTATVRHWLAKYGLRTQCPRGRPRRSGTQQAHIEGLRRAVVVCPQHGATEHVLDARGAYRCRRCRADAVVRRRRRSRSYSSQRLGDAVASVATIGMSQPSSSIILTPASRSLAWRSGGLTASTSFGRRSASVSCCARTVMPRLRRDSSSLRRIESKGSRSDFPWWHGPG
jgi:transposase